MFPQHYGPQAGLDSKEHLTDAKLRELFGANYKMVRYYDYDTGAYADGSRPQSEVDKSRYAKMKSLFEDDMRMTGVELVAIVSQNISTKDYIKHSGDIPGNIVKSPVSVPFDTRRFGHNAHVGMVLLRNKKTGKILPVPNDWIATGVLTNSMENDPFLTSASFGLPGVARVIDEELWRRDFDTYHKIVDLYFGQNIKQK